jgi:hypothetical protein
MMFAIGTGTCPTHGIDVRTLVTHAASRPVLSLRPRSVQTIGSPNVGETPRHFNHLARHREGHA